MPADYNIPMTDAQITEALQLMVERVSEGWAQETFDGSPVGSGSPYYHKSSKWWATQAADAAARAEAAVPAGTAGAVFFDREQSLTDAQAMQARANIVAGGSNRNLLDNPWFTVNQRSFTSSTGTNGVKTVDRWEINSGVGGTTKLENGMMVLDASASSSYITFEQHISDDLTGREVTLSVMDGNGTVYSKTAVVPAQTSGYAEAFRLNLGGGGNVHVKFFTRPAGNPSPAQVQFYVLNGNSFTIKAVKLELGSVSTLANDTAPNYAEELAKCQRYFVRIKTQNNSGYNFMAIGYTANATVVAVPLNIPANMRRITTVTMSGPFKAYKLDSSASYPITAITTSNQAPGIATLSATVSGATAGIPVIFQSAGDVNAFIDLSADL